MLGVVDSDRFAIIPSLECDEAALRSTCRTIKFAPFEYAVAVVDNKFTCSERIIEGTSNYARSIGTLVPGWELGFCGAGHDDGFHRSVVRASACSCSQLFDGAR